ARAMAGPRAAAPAVAPAARCSKRRRRRVERRTACSIAPAATLDSAAGAPGEASRRRRSSCSARLVTGGPLGYFISRDDMMTRSGHRPVRRRLRGAVAALAIVLAVLAFEAGLHAAHHLDDETPPAPSPLPSATSHPPPP